MVTIHPLGYSPPSATVEVARLRFELRDTSLRELDNKGVVIWDKNEGIVRKGEKFYEQLDELV